MEDDLRHGRRQAVTALCRLADLEPTGAKGVTLEGGREIVVVATADGPRAYLNACPHTGVTLETFPDRFLNAGRSELICSMHGARFLVGDGLCVSGPCLGRSLARVAIVLDGDAVIEA